MRILCQVSRLIIAAGKRGRKPLRNVVLCHLILRHDLCDKEALLARRSQFHLDTAGTGTLHIRWVKRPEDGTQTLGLRGGR
jgi:hypothetical protein